MTGILLFIAYITATLPAFADDNLQLKEGSLKASVLIAEPGKRIYSSAGHACIRLQYPAEGLDYCFSSEGEEIDGATWRFLSGRLMMGVRAVKTSEYKTPYAMEGRHITEYPLALKTSEIQELWRVCDEHVTDNIPHHYDFLHHGCALTCLQLLEEALTERPLTLGYSDKLRTMTRREIVDASLSERPWQRLALHALMGTEWDKKCDAHEKVILPCDLVEVLQEVGLLSSKSSPLPPSTEEKGLFPPMLLVMILLGICGVNYWFRIRYIDYAFLALQTILGTALCYLSFVSELPVSGFTWLLIPFNPLYFLFWHWRRRWVPMAIVMLAGWVFVVITRPHLITDWAFVLLAIVYLVFYARVYKHSI